MKRALAFYATDEYYALSALVFVERLRQLGMAADVDAVVLHLPLSPPLTALMRERDVVTKAVEPLQPVPDPYYRHALVKLHVFGLCDYDQVLVVDADSIPLKRLDDILSFPVPGPIAAARAYWLADPPWTTAMMLVRPSTENSRRVVRHAGIAASNNYFDMDLVNREFAGEIVALPETSFCLNAEWEVAGRRGHFADPDEAYATVAVVHFTALGKPWMYSTDQVRALRPHAHPAFYETWDLWHATRKAILRGRRFDRA